MSSPLDTQELGLLAAGVSKELDCSGNDIPERLHWARFVVVYRYPLITTLVLPALRPGTILIVGVVAMVTQGDEMTTAVVYLY